MNQELIELLKTRLVPLVLSVILPRYLGGPLAALVKVIALYLFGKFIEPILVDMIQEKIIQVDLERCKLAVKKYSEADTKVDRVDSFDNLP